FDHLTATAECTTCHASSSFSAWTGGKFHLAGSAAPSSCLPCHQGDRPNSTAGWVSSTWRSVPFDYATHGAGLDCATCHAGPGTGAWGGTQNWVGGNFAHAASALAASTCVACHTTQRPQPALLTSANAALPAGVQFDHSTATGDCVACHVSVAFTSWTGGKPPLASSATPSSWLTCH